MPEWAFNIATNEKDCPRCFATKGQPCHTPQGRKTMRPHGLRVSLLTDTDWQRCQGTALPFKNAFSLQINVEGKPSEKKE